jgi:hypothetical protein
MSVPGPIFLENYGHPADITFLRANKGGRLPGARMTWWSTLRSCGPIRTGSVAT